VIGPDGNVVFEAAPDIPDADLAHQYDATQISEVDGSSISNWADQAGSADLTQSTSSKQPTLTTSGINGKQSLVFDRSNSQQLIASIANIGQPYHVFAVIRLDVSGVGNQALIAFSDSTYYPRLFLNNSKNAFDFDLDGFGGGLTISPDKNPHIHTALGDGSTSSYRLDGSGEVTGDEGTAGISTVSVGGRLDTAASFASETVGELLIYNTELSNSDRDSVESYLADKWGITV